MTFQLSDQASADLEQIYYEGAWNFGIKQADKYSREIEAIFELLAANPLMARERTEFKRPVRVHPHRSHLIFYTIVDTGIMIVRVRHAHEDWMNDPA